MTARSVVARPAAGLGLVLLLGGCAGGPSPVASAPAVVATAAVTANPPTGSAASVANPLRDTGGDGILEPGTYVLDLFPVDVAFDIPDGSPPGWHVGASTADTAIVLWYTKPNITSVFAFWDVDHVMVDPCNPASGGVEPPIESTVGDLVAALSDLPAFEATAAVDVTVGSFRGSEIELTALSDAGACPEPIAFTTDDDATAVPASDTLRVQVLDVEGVRIVMTRDRWIDTREPLDRDPVAEAELQQILDSVRIQALT